jgi:hypothetical protein
VIPAFCFKERCRRKRRLDECALECVSLVQGLQVFLVDHGPAGIGESLGKARRKSCRPGR